MCPRIRPRGSGVYVHTYTHSHTNRAPWTQGDLAAQRTHTARHRREQLLGPVEEDSTFGVLIELARPQVHGFDLKCLSFVASRTHAYVSGADDEKVSNVCVCVCVCVCIGYTYVSGADDEKVLRLLNSATASPC